jgi:hypothetical protein
MLSRSHCSLLVRTDFSSDDTWRAVCDEALREYEDGFRAYLELVSDPAFDGAHLEAVRAAVSPDNHGAAVLFIADSTTFASPDHPVLVVDLLDDSVRPFRCIPAELWAVENNLNIANMDWGVFRRRGRRRRDIPRPPLIADREPPSTRRCPFTGARRDTPMRGGG